MTTALQATPVASRPTLWSGRILTAIPVLFLLMDGGMKLFKPEPVLSTLAQLGYPGSLAFGLGALQLLCVLLYVVPQTSVLGAILLTGYLGGAISAHVRVGNPLFSHTLFPLYIGLLLWGGLFLREPRLPALLPVRS